MPKIEKRKITIRYKDGTQLDAWLVACTVIQTDLKGVALHLDVLLIHEYRMIVNQQLLPSDKRIAAIEFD
jgi:hypothetical protein